MSSAPEHNFDLFISYARADNRDHWIDELGAGLEEELGQVLGREVRVFVDRSEFANELSGHFTAAIADSNVFVPVLSPSYLASESCMSSDRIRAAPASHGGNPQPWRKGRSVAQARVKSAPVRLPPFAGFPKAGHRT